MVALIRNLLARTLIGAVVALALASAPASAQDSGGGTVTAQNVQFMPPTLTVAAGTAITWTNADPFQHSVTADDGSFDSGLIEPGDTFSLTFTDSGVYAYYCIPHGGPGGAGMSGTITVE